MIDPHTPPKCGTCADIRWISEEISCGDPDHSGPAYPCPDCNPEGDLDDPI